MTAREFMSEDIGLPSVEFILNAYQTVIKHLILELNVKRERVAELENAISSMQQMKGYAQKDKA